MQGGKFIPLTLLLAGDFPETGADQIVLGAEMPIQRHLIGAGGLGDRVDPDTPDTVLVEQAASRRHDPLAWLQSEAGCSRLRQHRRYLAHDP